MAAQSHIDAACTGRLGFDPEQKESKNGASYTTASITVEGPDGPEYVKIVAFGDAAEALAKLDKGDLVAVEGFAKIERWTGKDGKETARLAITARYLRHIGQIGRRRPPDAIPEKPLRNTIPRQTTAQLWERLGE